MDDLHEKPVHHLLHLHGKLSEAKSSINDDHVVDIGDKEIQLGDMPKTEVSSGLMWFGLVKLFRILNLPLC